MGSRVVCGCFVDQNFKGTYNNLSVIENISDIIHMLNVIKLKFNHYKTQVY